MSVDYTWVRTQRKVRWNLNNKDKIQHDAATMFHVIYCSTVFSAHTVASTFRHLVQVLCWWERCQLAGRLPAETPSLRYHRCSQSGTPGHREEVWKVRIWDSCFSILFFKIRKTENELQTHWNTLCYLIMCFTLMVHRHGRKGGRYKHDITRLKSLMHLLSYVCWIETLKGKLAECFNVNY